MDAVVQEINFRADSTIPAFRQHVTICSDWPRSLIIINYFILSGGVRDWVRWCLVRKWAHCTNSGQWMVEWERLWNVNIQATWRISHLLDAKCRDTVEICHREGKLSCFVLWSLGLKCCPNDRLEWMRACGFLQSLDASSEYFLKLGHDTFHPFPFKFIFNGSSSPFRPLASYSVP
jgi:hypothetical protein